MRRLDLLLGLLLASFLACSPPPCLEGFLRDSAGNCVKAADSKDTGSDSGDQQDTTEDQQVSTEDLDQLTPFLTSAVGWVETEVPAELITTDDSSYGNTLVRQVLDEGSQTVGYARRIFTPVACVSGVCDAVIFVLVYDAAFQALGVYHSPTESFPLMKYWEDLYLVFSEEDMLLVNAVVQNRPDVLLTVSGEGDLVEGLHSTAPTLEVYQDVVVRGAVFTVWVIVVFAEETEALLSDMFEGVR